MKVMILAHESPGDFALRDNKEKFDSYMGEWYAYSGAMKDAGVMLDGAALEPPSTALAAASALPRPNAENAELHPPPPQCRQRTPRMGTCMSQ